MLQIGIFSNIMGHIFVDESSNINFRKKTGYFVTSYVFCKNPEILRDAMNRVLTRMSVFGRYPDLLKELKFYPQWNKLVDIGYSPDSILEYQTQIHNVRIQSINAVRDNCDGIFISCLDNKTTNAATWSHEKIGNFVTKRPLIYDMIPSLSLAEPPLVCFDRGRLAERNMEKFYSYLEFNPYGVTKSHFCEVDSISEPCIWAADMVSGAFFHKYQNNDSTYADLISSKLVGKGIVKFWNSKKGTPP
jgi:hypothetical protein